MNDETFTLLTKMPFSQRPTARLLIESQNTYIMSLMLDM